MALPNDSTTTARPGEGGMFTPRSQAGRARSCAIHRSRCGKPSIGTRAHRWLRIHDQFEMSAIEKSAASQ